MPYALYKAEGYVQSILANKTGFDEEDLELLWKSILNMFENDHSSLRGKMCMRKLIIFKHDSLLGNAPSHKLFELVKIVKKDENKVTRNYSDYDISISSDILEGVEIIEK
ncbi:MAG: type I CRISPR-associated protein Cas7 [Clostridia bacterium]